MKRSFFTTININKTYIIFLCGLFLAKAMIAWPSWPPPPPSPAEIKAALDRKAAEVVEGAKKVVTGAIEKGKEVVTGAVEGAKKALCASAGIGNQLSLGGIGVYNDSDYKIRVTLSYGIGVGECPWEKVTSVELEPFSSGWLSAYYGIAEGLTGDVRFKIIQVDAYSAFKEGEWEKEMLKEPLFKKTGGSILSGNYCMTLYLVDRKNAKNETVTVYDYTIYGIKPGEDCSLEGAKGKIK